MGRTHSTTLRKRLNSSDEKCIEILERKCRKLPNISSPALGEPGLSWDVDHTVNQFLIATTSKAKPAALKRNLKGGSFSHRCVRSQRCQLGLPNYRKKKLRVCNNILKIGSSFITTGFWVLFPAQYPCAALALRKQNLSHAVPVYK